MRDWTAADAEVPWLCSSRCLWFSLKLEVNHLQRARNGLGCDSGDLDSEWS